MFENTSDHLSFSSNIMNQVATDRWVRARGWRGLMCLAMKIVCFEWATKVSTFFFLTRKFVAQKNDFLPAWKSFLAPSKKIFRLSREPITKFSVLLFRCSIHFLFFLCGQIDPAKIIFERWHQCESFCSSKKRQISIILLLWWTWWGCDYFSVHHYLFLIYDFSNRYFLAKVWRPAVLFISTLIIDFVHRVITQECKVIFVVAKANIVYCIIRQY